MRIAVCSADMDERHALSKLTETALLRRGLLSEMILFSMPQELLAATVTDTPLSAAFIVGAEKTQELGSICRRVPVILVGGKMDGADAFDLGARYFLNKPVDTTQLEKALNRCIGGEKENWAK